MLLVGSLSLAVAGGLALALRLQAHTLSPRRLSHLMASLGHALLLACALPAARWLSIRPFEETQGYVSAALGFTHLVAPVLIAASLLQLGMVYSYLSYRRELLAIDEYVAHADVDVDFDEKESVYVRRRTSPAAGHEPDAVHV